MVGLLVSCALLGLAGALNVDVEHPIVFSDPTRQLESYFGFTVSLLKDPGFNADAWLVIGAPKANSSHYAHSTINEPGVVYLCKLERNSECQQLTLDDTGNVRVSGATHDYSYTDKKDHAWIGGALAVQGSGNGRFVACGPRWKNQYYQGHYLMNGVCYWLPGPKDIHQNAGKLLPLVRRGN
ncbi:hypothetical protein J437_LFUL012002 [Ladona fulva]|uniref:Uncharacterized protein n=1 Tax=Ladona fulva TaxID=123851 RepID=A0A8K0KBL3_LADFU|nr:hypothetical protein J437_LFUL012002 [Ladona fulva]